MHKAEEASYFIEILINKGGTTELFRLLVCKNTKGRFYFKERREINMELYKNKIYEKLFKKFYNCDIGITVPPNSDIGDISIPCFVICKELKKDFKEIFTIIENELKDLSFIEKYEQKGGYLNIFLKKENVIEEILNRVITEKDFYGSSYSGKNKNAIIEHTSINPNASPHIGRARNALIGDCLVRLMKFEGYNVHTHYFVNDVGKQIAMLVLGSRNKEDIKFDDLLNIYVTINNELKENAELEKEVFDLLYRFEHKDKGIIEEFKKVVDICIEGQSKLFNELNIKYDYYDRESKYVFEGSMKTILDEINRTGHLFEAEDGRLAVNLDKYNLPVLVVTRNDKTSLYPLRDIAYSIDKANFNFEKNIIVLGEDQKLYFNQIKSVLDLLGINAPEAVHYSFILLSSGKMSTRTGKVVLLEEIMEEAVIRVTEEMKKRYDRVDNNIVKAIAYGAVKYTILKISNERNVIFDWEAALNFEGNTSLYIQYNYVRICSMLNKDKELVKANENIDYSMLKGVHEYELIKSIADFSEVIQKTISLSSPHIICGYLYKLSKLFSKFYHEYPILNVDNEELKKARMTLAIAVKQVIKNGLNILGIEVVGYM